MHAGLGHEDQDADGLISAPQPPLASRAAVGPPDSVTSHRPASAEPRRAERVWPDRPDGLGSVFGAQCAVEVDALFKSLYLLSLKGSHSHCSIEDDETND